MIYTNSCLVKLLLCVRLSCPKDKQGRKVFIAINVLTEASSLCLGVSKESRR